RPAFRNPLPRGEHGTVHQWLEKGSVRGSAGTGVVARRTAARRALADAPPARAAPVGAVAPAGTRRPRRSRAAPRPVRPTPSGAAGTDRPLSAAGTVPRAAHGGAGRQRPAGRGAGGVPGRAPSPGRGTRRRAGSRTSTAASTGAARRGCAI